MRVLVAMSGGVDSSVAASRLLEEGHDVTGVTLKLWDGPSDQGCCTVADVDDARQVAAQLGIAHHVFNMTEAFEGHVIAPYVAAHRAGRTPNPCIECNRHLKFDALLDATDRLGFDALATGHHARITQEASTRALRRGVDPAKDQSYVVSMLTQHELARVLFPVGEMTKDEVRAHARDRGLRTASKSESQDTCFIESSGGRKRFLSERASLTAGQIVDAATGDVVGQVDALELITVGQRKSLGVDGEGRRRVAVAIDVSRRAVVVSSPEASMITRVTLEPGSITWVDEPVADGGRLVVQMRAHASPLGARIHADRLTLAHEVDPVAPGQTVAFFAATDPSMVVGSAVIAA